MNLGIQYLEKLDLPIEFTSSIILLMFPIYTANENTWVFIDEPENHLHPGFQKIFFKNNSS